MRWQFVAGAACPKCGAEDAIQVASGVQPPRRRCVECGFEETLSEESPVAAAAPQVVQIAPLSTSKP